MTAISAQLVKQLREMTGAGMMDAKKALVETAGDLDAASDLLRKKGLAQASKKAGRETGEGLVHSYIHAGGKVGVLLQINCETDFVARTDVFQALTHDIALHIAANSPQYIDPESIPSDILDKEKEIYVEAAKAENKPVDIAEKIAEGKLERFYEQNCLLLQPFVKDPEQTIADVLNAAIAKLGENIKIGNFARFQIGA